MLWSNEYWFCLGHAWNSNELLLYSLSMSTVMWKLWSSIIMLVCEVTCVFNIGTCVCSFNEFCIRIKKKTYGIVSCDHPLPRDLYFDVHLLSYFIIPIVTYDHGFSVIRQRQKIKFIYIWQTQLQRRWLRWWRWWWWVRNANCSVLYDC